MTAKTMADVLEELDKHRPDHREYEGGWWELACAGCDFAKGERLSHLDWAPYRVHRAEVFAAALSAAGFGLVADAKAEALEEAAANIITNDPLDYWNGHLPEGLGFQEAMSRWLKAHAKAKRATS